MLRHVRFRMDAFRRLHAVVAPIDLNGQKFGERRVGIMRLAVEAAERHPPADHREPPAGAHIVPDHREAIGHDFSAKRLGMKEEAVGRGIGDHDHVVGLHLR